MYKNILLTIDLNDETSYRKPLLSAIELARAFGARLQVLTGVRRLGNLQSGDRQQAAWLRCRRTSGRGRSVSSNLTGRPVFFCRTVARSTAYPAGATSSTRSATTSQPRSLLSTARLNNAKSRVRPSICNRVRIDQTCFGRSGGFWPMSLPLFQGSRRGFEGIACASISMVILLVCEA